MSAPDQQPARRRAAVVFILITAWIDVLSWGVTIPVYPQMIERFTGGDLSTAAFVLGVLMTLFAAIQLFAAPALGALSDRYGRRPVILFSCLGLSLDLLAMAFAPNLWWLAATRIVHAITAASFSAANAYIADVTPAEDRAKAFGYLGAAFSFGFIVGPGLGGLLGQIDIRLPFLVGAGLAFVNVLYGYFVLPESLPADKRAPFAWRQANPFGALAFLRREGVLAMLALILLAVNLANQLYPSLWVLYTNARYEWDALMVGVTLAVYGAMGIVVQSFMVQPIVKRLGERLAMCASLVIWIAAFLIEGAAPTTAIFLIGLPLGALAAFGGPALSALMTERVGADEQGRLQGANSAILSVAGLIGPGLYTGVFALTHASIAPGAAYYVAALILAAGLVLAWRAPARTAVA